MFFSGFKSITQRETSRAQGVCVSCPSPGQDTQTPKIPTSDCLSILSHNYFKWAKLSVNPLYFTVFLSYKWIITQNRTYNAGKYIEDKELEKVLMKTEGLGTEATRAGIITMLKDRGYIEIRKNLVFATAKAKILIQALGGQVLASPEMTAKWERRLKEIGQGEASPKQFIDQTEKMVTHLVKQTTEASATWSFEAEIKDAFIPGKKNGKRVRNTSLGNCKLCGGSVVDKGNLYGCSNYQKTKCTFSISKKILGKTITQKHLKQLLNDGSTELIEGFKGKEKSFNAMLVWDEKERKTKFTFANNG